MLELAIRDDEGKERTVLIEARTYNIYEYMTSSIFKREVLKEFRRLDKHHKSIWVVAITPWNIDVMKPLCDKFDMYIMPVPNRILSSSMSGETEQH